MKLLCDISVGNRLAPNLKRKSAKSTLALCKQPNSKDCCIILFTSQNKSGTKYNLKGNIQQIFTRCVNDGKSTIQFKEPPHDLFIQADAIQLKGFLHLLKRALQHEITDKDLVVYSSMAVTPISGKAIPQKTLHIRSRAEYPLKGFPKTLEVLRINNIRRCSLDNGILNLKALRVLDLSTNLIETLPESLNRLHCLTELNLSDNQLGKCPPKQWSWMGGNLSETLRVLNLRRNALKYLPCQIVKLYNLVYLHVDNNELKAFPTGIGKLNKLKVLTASNNDITWLPGSAKMWHLQQLDLSCNRFQPQRASNSATVLPKPPPPCSLKECAARTVLLLRIPYTPCDLPLTLIDYLDNAQYCVCGRACFEIFIKHSQMLLLDSITDHLSISAAGSLQIPMECHYCSLKCYVSAHCIRMRSPVI